MFVALKLRFSLLDLSLTFIPAGPRSGAGISLRVSRFCQLELQEKEAQRNAAGWEAWPLDICRGDRSGRQPLRYYTLVKLKTWRRTSQGKCDEDVQFHAGSMWTVARTNAFWEMREDCLIHLAVFAKRKRKTNVFVCIHGPGRFCCMFRSVKLKKLWVCFKRIFQKNV